MKYIPRTRTLLLPALLFLLGSCKNLYVQKNVFVPAFREKGELKLEGTLAREGASYNIGYAPGEHIGLMLNGLTVYDNGGGYQTKYNQQFEGAVGYYTTFMDSLSFECYAGGTRGWLNSSYDRPVNEIGRFAAFGVIGAAFFTGFFPFLFFSETMNVNGTGSYYSTFLQNSIVIHSEGNTFSFTGRVQEIHFDSYKEEGYDLNGKPFWYNVNVPSKLFLQPVVTDKIMLTPGLDLSLQLGLNLDPYNKIDAFQWNTLFFNIGLQASLNPLKMRSRSVQGSR
jgi:hypothetical protein